MTALVAHRDFLSGVLQRQSERRRLVDPSHAFPSQPILSEAGPSRPRASPAGIASKLNVVNYVQEEETVRNDYCEWYGASGEWGSNFVLGAEDHEVCEEYPALRRLMDLKNELVDQVSHPPLYLTLPLPQPNFPSTQTPSPQPIQTLLGSNRFDSILITPPQPLDWNYISSLPLRAISADPGFVFLWVGAASGEGLERGRECFAKWGFRRAEDIVWVKTNKRQSEQGEGANGGVRTEGRDEGGLFAGQKEHCLMGIRGTVRRSTDGRFVHCNVDTDIMLWEESGGELLCCLETKIQHVRQAETTERSGPRYPPYLQTLVENFCLGTRRLHLFGEPSTARRGWVTAGTEEPILPASADTSDMPAETDTPRVIPGTFDPLKYPSQVFKCDDGRPTLPYHPDIDTLRPKSPRRKSRNLPGSGTPIMSGGGRGGHNASGRQGGARYGAGSGLQIQGQMQYPNQAMQIGMGMGMGVDGMNFQGYAQQPTFGAQPGQGQQQQAQFDPVLLAQAQAQAHAAIQAQMHMAMMQQMQAGMGMGMGIGMGMNMGQNQMFQQQYQGMYGQPQQFGQYGQMMGMGMGIMPQGYQDGQQQPGADGGFGGGHGYGYQGQGQG